MAPGGLCGGKPCEVDEPRVGYIGPGNGSCKEGTRPGPRCGCASGDLKKLGGELGAESCLNGELV